MRAQARSSLLVAAGFIGGTECSVIGFIHAADPVEPRVQCSIDEILQNVAHAETFSGSYGGNVP